MTPRPRRSGEQPATPDVAPDALTAPVEDYLKAVYEIELGGQPAATTDLAQRLGVAPPSVTGMVRRLADQGLMTHERYKGARLTEAGRRAALRTLRRHRVIEAYLTQALGYPWDRVHEEAERLEHAASDELIDRMAQAIGEPRTDPHGAPIPTRDGDVHATRPSCALAELTVGATARVARVRDEDPALLRHLATLGLVPGTRITLLDRAPYGGPLTLAVDGQEQRVGPALAAEVQVEAE